MNRKISKVNGVEPKKTAALKVLNRKNSVVNCVQPKNRDVNGVEPGKKRH